jgi:hypothetical protein
MSGEYRSALKNLIVGAAWATNIAIPGGVGSLGSIDFHCMFFRLVFSVHQSSAFPHLSSLATS